MNKILILCFLTIFSTGIATAEPLTKDSKNEFVKRQMDKARESLLHEGPSFEINGKLEKGRHERYSINGEEVTINSSTQVDGVLSEGKTVHMTGKLKSGLKIAENVLVIENSKNNPPPSNSVILGH